MSKKYRYYLRGFEGEIVYKEINTDQSQELLDHLMSELSKRKPSRINRVKNKIFFQVDIFRFVSNVNIFGMVDKGKVIVYTGVPGIIRYKISFIRFLIIMTVFAILSIAFLLSANVSQISDLLFIPIFIWLFGYGLNYIIAVLRLKSLFLKAGDY